MRVNKHITKYWKGASKLIIATWVKEMSDNCNKNIMSNESWLKNDWYLTQEKNKLKNMFILNCAKTNKAESNRLKVSNSKDY